MDQKLILGGMNQRLIEAGKDNNFYYKYSTLI